jgi:hypothetical protein
MDNLQAGLEMKIMQLQREKDFWFLKEVLLVLYKLITKSSLIWNI